MDKIEIPKSFIGTFEGCSGWDGNGVVFKKVIEKIQPKNICEVGFFRGSSSYMLLHLSNANVTSVDPMADVEFPQNPRKHDGSIENTEKLKELFPNRFTFYQIDSRFIYPFIKDNIYDLAFLDGSHFASFVRSDIELALKLKIPYILLDDFNGDVSAVYYNEYNNRLLETIEIFDTETLGNGEKNKMCFCKPINL